MRNFKTTLLLLLTLLLLAVFGALPVIAALVQDGAAVRSPGQRPLQPFLTDRAAVEETMPMMGKLKLMSNHEAMNIEPSQAAMTEEEALAAAQALMQAYEDAGIFSWFTPSYSYAAPKLGVELSDPDNFLVYWTVTYIGDQGDRSLMLDIDDETGKLLCIRYDVYDTFSMDGVWKRNRKLMDQFTAVYFDQLGLNGEAEQAQTDAYSEIDGGVSIAHYSIGDERYGEIAMDFYVEGAGGFYVVFPN